MVTQHPLSLPFTGMPCLVMDHRQISWYVVKLLSWFLGSNYSCVFFKQYLSTLFSQPNYPISEDHHSTLFLDATWVKSWLICLFLYGLLHLMQCPQDVDIVFRITDMNFCRSTRL